jgi:hypothetical protein
MEMEVDEGGDLQMETDSLANVITTLFVGYTFHFAAFQVFQNYYSYHV